MSPAEVFTYIDAKRPPERFGNITEYDADAMAEAREKLLAKGVEIL